MIRRLTAEATFATVREAAIRCIAEGLYPTRVALRAAGARGDWASISRSFRYLVETKEIILPPKMAAKWAACMGISRMSTTGMAPVRIPRPLDSSTSPCAAEVRDYRAAWRRILKPLKREVTHVS